MIDYLNSPNRCFVKNCHKEQLEAIDKNKKISDNMNSIIQKLIKNEITQEQANIKLNKLKDSVINNSKRVRLLNCQFNNCYKVMEKNILKDLNSNMKMTKEKTEKQDIYLYTLSNDYYQKFKKNKINTKDYIKYTNKAMNNI
jgi:hypothetical protein